MHTKDTETLVGAMDTRQERELAVYIDTTAVYGPLEHVVRLKDTTIVPGWGCVLTPAEARAIARKLDEAADRAEMAGLDADSPIDVPMVCTACRHPVYYRGGDPARGWVGGVWSHTTLDAAGACGLSHGAVKAMVAAGNESMPRG